MTDRPVPVWRAHAADYARAHLVGQIMLCCRRNHAAFRRYLERSPFGRLAQINAKIMGD